MLLDRGPVDPVDVDLWTRPGPRSTLEGDAAALAGQLAGAQARLGSNQSTMASFPSSRVEGSAGGDLNNATVAHAGQNPNVDSAIGAVASNADGQASSIVGLGNDAAQAIADASPPAPPDFRHHPPDDKWNIPPGGGGTPTTPGGPVTGKWPRDATNFLTSEFAKFYRRNVLVDEWDLWLPTWPNQDAIESAILASDEYAADVNKLYHDYFHRDVQGDELADARNNHWTLDQVEDDLRKRS